MQVALFPVHTYVSDVPTTVYECLDAGVFDYPFFNDGVLHRDRKLQCASKEQESRPTLKLAGFIFHSAHCGSTLLGRMLHASPRVRSISETEAINGLLLSFALYKLPEQEVIERLQNIMGDYLQKLGDEVYAIFKLTSWNVFFLPLFQQAFPEVPWLYLYREEQALINSLMASGKGFVDWFDLPADIIVRAFIPNEIPLQSKEEYLLQMSRRQFEMAQNRATQNGKLLLYPDFLEVFTSSILTHFDIEFQEDELSAAREMQQYEAKSYHKQTFQAKS